ncbi:hypothetical protein [Deinococcus sonorensis]|uniref:ArsR family transcriptional regulator n=2 Tax=Deinococcus sonorensis TaxID=309891 RepID=A0AAU7UDU3_9DEIO
MTLPTILAPYHGEWFEVRTAEQARLLSDPAALRMLEPFIGQERSAGHAAREAGVSVARLLYRVQQFLAAGVLREVRQERRAGRPIRIYAAPGGFHVPFHLTSFTDLEERVRIQTLPFDQLRNRAAARQLAHEGLSGRLIYRSGGDLHTETALPAGQTWAQRREQLTGGDYVGVFWLAHSDARWLQAQLDTLRLEVQRRAQPAGGGQPYLLQTAFLEVQPDEAGYGAS